MSRIFKVSTDVLLGHADKNHATLDITGLTNEQVIVLKDLIENYRKVNAFTSMFNTLTVKEQSKIRRFIETGKD